MIDDEGNQVLFTPAVLKEDFRRCQAINDKQKKDTFINRSYLPLRGQVRCAHCGGIMTPQIQKGKYVYYYCQTNQSCSGRIQNPDGSTNYHKIAGNTLFPQIERILKEGFQLSREEFTRYLVYLEKQAVLNRELRKTDLNRIAATKGHIKKLMEERTREYNTTISRLENITSEKIRRFEDIYDKDMARFSDRLKHEQEKEQQIFKADSAWTQKLSSWLEHMQKSHKYWHIADLDEKRTLASNIFLELVIENGELASYSYNQPYEACKIVDLSYNGGGSLTRIEPTTKRVYEHLSRKLGRKPTLEEVSEFDEPLLVRIELEAKWLEAAKCLIEQADELFKDFLVWCEENRRIVEDIISIF